MFLYAGDGEVSDMKNLGVRVRAFAHLLTAILISLSFALMLGSQVSQYVNTTTGMLTFIVLFIIYFPCFTALLALDNSS
jgi:hypothetical protein